MAKITKEQHEFPLARTEGLLPMVSDNSLDLKTLREFCKREGEVVTYSKGDQMEREGDPTRWFAFVEYGCFKYLTYGISDDKEHVVWFSFKDEFVGDYPACLNGLPAQITIKATMPSRVIRITGEQLNQFFDQNTETMELRSLIAEHMTDQFRLRYQNLYCATPRERYKLLLQRCPDIMQDVALKDIASFLNIAPTFLGKLRKEYVHTR